MGWPSEQTSSVASVVKSRRRVVLRTSWTFVGLMSSIPKGDGSRLRPIPGSPPNMLAPPTGCAFRPRCAYSAEICEVQVPALRLVGKNDQLAACHFSEQLMGHWGLET